MPAVALQLLLGLVQLVKQIVQCVLHIAGKRDVSVMHLLLQKAEHIIKRHAVIVQTVDDLAVLVMIDSVGTVQRLGNLIVQIGQLGQLARGQRIGQHIAVHRLDVGKAHRGFDLGAAVQFVK